MFLSLCNPSMAIQQNTPNNMMAQNSDRATAEKLFNEGMTQFQKDTK